MITHPPRARLFIVIALALASAFSVGMHVIRPRFVSGISHEWLPFNLGLAWIPFLVSLAIYDRTRNGGGGPFLWLLIGTWLTFLPNAPYIVTDLIHLSELGGEPILYDATMYLAFAWTGLMLGLVSLYLVHCAMRTRYGARVGWLVVSAAALLTGVGIYLGRVLRWNSWDILTQPTGVLADLARLALNPFDSAGMVVALFAGLFAVSYLAVYSVAELRADRL